MSKQSHALDQTARILTQAEVRLAEIPVAVDFSGPAGCAVRALIGVSPWSSASPILRIFMACRVHR
jgi:hypothetical protein